MTRPVSRPVAYAKTGVMTTKPAAPIARERFTSGDTNETRVRQLENQVRALTQTTDAARAATTPRTIEVTFTAAGQTKDVYMHSFGRPATWRICDWRPQVALAIPIFASIAHPNESNVLRIRCGNNTGTVKFEVS